MPTFVFDFTYQGCTGNNNANVISLTKAAQARTMPGELGESLISLTKATQVRKMPVGGVTLISLTKTAQVRTIPILVFALTYQGCTSTNNANVSL